MTKSQDLFKTDGMRKLCEDRSDRLRQREAHYQRTLALLLLTMHSIPQNLQTLSAPRVSEPVNLISHNYVPAFSPPLLDRSHRMEMNFQFEMPEEDFEEYDDEDDEEEEAAVAMTPFEKSAAELIKSNKPLTNMTVAELKEGLKSVGQKTAGRKSDLVERLEKVLRKFERGLPLTDNAVKADPTLRWYILQTANGFEGVVESKLKTMIDTLKLHSKIERVWVPIPEGETSVRLGSVMPSYIYIRMKMDSMLYDTISNLQYVVNFVGFDHGGKTATGNMVGNRGFVRPMPISDKAFDRIMGLANENDALENESDLSSGDVLEVLEGPFKGMRGAVVSSSGEEMEEEDIASDMVTLSLLVMGREMPVPVPLKHCVKVQG